MPNAANQLYKKKKKNIWKLQVEQGDTPRRMAKTQYFTKRGNAPSTIEQIAKQDVKKVLECQPVSWDPLRHITKWNASQAYTI